MLRKLFVAVFAVATLAVAAPAQAEALNYDQTCRFTDKETNQTMSCSFNGSSPACRGDSPSRCAEWRSVVLYWEDGTQRTFLNTSYGPNGPNTWQDNHPSGDRVWRYVGKKFYSSNELPSGAFVRVGAPGRIEFGVKQSRSSE